MPIDVQNARQLLHSLDLNRLFVEELNWSNPGDGVISLPVDDHKFTLKPVATQAKLTVFEVRNPGGDGIPELATRKKIHKLVSNSHAYEHILVFVNRPRTTTLWSWLRREDGKAPRPNEHRFHIDQPGDSLLQRLAGLAFDWEELDENGRATIIQVTDKVREQFSRNAEQVTKKFYDEFKRQHDGFLKFITGIDELRDNEWYASVMLNRLMFIYFIQCKRFLDGDPAYLKNRLTCCQMEGVPFYRNFLVPLFFMGFATDKDDRPEEIKQLLGDVPYLNGGLFLPHQIERQATEGDQDPTPETIGIDIPDEAFERLFEFFDRYHWHLDDRPLRGDNEINPDVLGYIFEKYINQKQMGAYYTKEDITEYISRNTVLPFLFDKLRGLRWDAVVPLPITDIEPYIFEAVRKGVDLDLPDYIAAGIDAVSERGRWNEAADPEFALPTETWREHLHRRERVQRIRKAFADGEITEINDFITHNLDIVAFTHDFLNDTDDPLTILNFYFTCLKQVTILDPTCGSGAFLFAALNLLEPLYEICLERMEEFVHNRARHRQWATDFEAELAQLRKHPSRNYFIYKSIIVNNLFGVDIMEEAVEICKLRLFLKLASQVDDPDRIEPLPDIDFNILAGNTLVGYATYEQILEAKQPGAKGSAQMDFSGIIDRVKSVDHKIKKFRGLQMQMDVDSRMMREQKQNLNDELRAVKQELDQDLAFEYGFKPAELERFIESHKPFHWYVEFNEILTRTPGGFDVVIGNPPWVEYSQIRRDGYSIRGYSSESCRNLYAFCTERSIALLRDRGRLGFIVQLPLVSAHRMEPLRNILVACSQSLHLATFDDRPGKLFEGLEHCRSVVFLTQKSGEQRNATDVYATRYNRWYQEERETLASRIHYSRSRIAPDYAILPKTGSKPSREILARLLAQRLEGSLGDQTVDVAPHFIFYQEAMQYWSKGYDRLPLYRRNGRRGAPAHGRYAYFPSAKASRVASALLNSSTFYLWYILLSDCYHLSDALFRAFPCPTEVVDDAGLAALGEALGAMIDEHADHQSITTSAGDVIEYAKFNLSPCKPLIDRIDRVLAEHYGFTDEELDFIINYDIKYRMGGADE